jgi:hypothetical protein
MFLTNFSSAFGRNIILPSGRIISNSLTRERFVARAGLQERGPGGGPAQPRGTYLTNVGYPISPNDAVMRKLPAIALMIAATTAMNYGTREVRRASRADGNSTYVDQRSVPMKVFAAIDQAGFTGNLSMPINVLNALRYQREAAQVASGPFLGGLAGLVDAARTLLSDQNSENTPTAERAFAKILYDMALRPIAQTGLQMLTPNSTIGDMVNFAGAQAMAMPAVREAFMRWTAHEVFDAGNEGRRVPPTKANLMKAYELKLITIEQLSAGLQERYEYDSFAKMEKANRDAYEANKSAKELEGK